MDTPPRPDFILFPLEAQEHVRSLLQTGYLHGVAYNYIFIFPNNFVHLYKNVDPNVSSIYSQLIQNDNLGTDIFIAFSHNLLRPSFFCTRPIPMKPEQWTCPVNNPFLRLRNDVFGLIPPRFCPSGPVYLRRMRKTASCLADQSPCRTMSSSPIDILDPLCDLFSQND